MILHQPFDEALPAITTGHPPAFVDNGDQLTLLNVGSDKKYEIDVMPETICFYLSKQ